MSITALFDSFLSGQFEGRDIADIKSANNLLAQGVISEQIGIRLHIKPTTVKDHIGKIYMKLT
jgi:hypothetical protein